MCVCDSFPHGEGEGVGLLQLLAYLDEDFPELPKDTGFYTLGGWRWRRRKKKEWKAYKVRYSSEQR